METGEGKDNGCGQGLAGAWGRSEGQGSSCKETERAKTGTDAEVKEDSERDGKRAGEETVKEAENPKEGRGGGGLLFGASEATVEVGTGEVGDDTEPPTVLLYTKGL